MQIDSIHKMVDMSIQSVRIQIAGQKLQCKLEYCIIKFPSFYAVEHLYMLAKYIMIKTTKLTVDCLLLLQNLHHHEVLSPLGT